MLCVVVQGLPHTSLPGARLFLSLVCFVYEFWVVFFFDVPLEPFVPLEVGYHCCFSFPPLELLHSGKCWPVYAMLDVPMGSGRMVVMVWVVAVLRSCRVPH